MTDKKNIEIDQIREIIKFTNQSSFNNKSRFIILDDVEFLNINSSKKSEKLDQHAAAFILQGYLDFLNK